MKKIRFVIIGIVLYLMLIGLSYATDYSSTSFIVRDPVITIGGGISTSSSFQIYSTAGQMVIGEETSASFTQRSGSQYYPTFTSPALSVTAGDTQVTLSWTAGEAELGYTVTAYEIGQSTTSGSGYTYTNVGNVTSATASSLTNETTYYFVIRVLDAFGAVITTSSEGSGTPQDSGEDEVVEGGGVLPSPSPTQQRLSSITVQGWAYPLSEVTILKDGIKAITTISGPDSKFDITLEGLTPGSYQFTVYTEDEEYRKSALFTFPTSLTSGAKTTVSGIFLAPTIDVDKGEVKKGDNIAIFGQSMPNSDITIGVASEEEIFIKTDANEDGVYLYNFDTSILEYGEHDTRSKAAYENIVSPFSGIIGFTVGEENVRKEAPSCTDKDLNHDGKINLTDFSILAYWYEQELNSEMLTIESFAFNADGKVDLADFSILAYCWTG